MYFAVIDRKIVGYVGMTVRSIRTRWQAHHRAIGLRGMGDLTIAYVSDEPITALAQIEIDTARALAPAFNVQGSGKSAREVRGDRPPSTTGGGLICSSQQWTPKQAAWLDATAERLGLTSRGAVARMLVQRAMSAEEPAP